MKRTSFLRLLLVALPLLLALGAGGRLYADGEGSLGGGSNGDLPDRGDNPVVGSLPCIVDPRLDGLFWIPYGTGKPDSAILDGIPAILGLVGPPEGRGLLLDAWGTPNGVVGESDDWTTFGLVLDGTVVLDRSAVANQLGSLWLFVPEGYDNGSISVTTGGTTRTQPLLEDLLDLDLASYALSPDLYGGACVVVTPSIQNAALPKLTVQISWQPGVISYQYLP